MALTPEQVRKAARRRAMKYGLDPDVFERQIGAESNFQTKAVSPAGARGPAQIMPATAKAWGVDIYDKRIGDDLEAAAKNMADYVEKYGGYENALRAYNAGPGAIEKSKGYGETNAYVQKILKGQTPRTSQVAIPSTTRDDTRATGSSTQDRLGSFLDIVSRLNVTTQRDVPTPIMDSLMGRTSKPDEGPSIVEENWELINSLKRSRQSLQQGTVEGTGAEVDPNTPRSVEKIFEEAALIDQAQVPYLWGGGHGKKQSYGSKVTPLDCSGAVSRVLGIDPRVSGDLASWGEPGEGKHVTIYANPEHVLMKINGKFWGTSKANPGGGAGWIPAKAVSSTYLSRFTKRHPKGM